MTNSVVLNISRTSPPTWSTVISRRGWRRKSRPPNRDQGWSETVFRDHHDGRNRRRPNRKFKGDERKALNFEMPISHELIPPQVCSDTHPQLTHVKPTALFLRNQPPKAYRKSSFCRTIIPGARASGAAAIGIEADSNRGAEKRGIDHDDVVQVSSRLVCSALRTRG